jgi:hypothetical protein
MTEREPDPDLQQTVDALRRDQPELLAAAYQAAEGRRAAVDQMMWQAPGLSLTAQAFLLTVSLQPGTGQVGRALSGILGLAVAIASIQLLLKHRHHETQLSYWLEEVEWAARLPRLNSPRDRNRVAATSGARTGGSSVTWWTWTLGAFGVVDLIVISSALLSWPRLAA